MDPPPLAVFSSCPVTTVLFVGPFIVAGSGSRILIYSAQSLKLISEVNIFRGANVRGLKEISGTTPPDGSNVKICAFGAKNVHVVQLGPMEMDKNACSVTTLARAPTFEDWVWDVHGLHIPLIAVALGHNFVALWNWKENIRIHTVHCEDKSILYSACFVGNNWGNLTIFAGTVYKEIVIWYPGYDGQSDELMKQQPVAQRLTGHDGVVFSVNYDQSKRLLSSTSDDRSVRIWKNMLDDSDENKLKPNWTFQLIHTLYGHGARVWRATVVDRYLLSVGEDSNICVWQHDDGKLIKKVKCHRGGGTWAIAVSNDKEPLVATGGRDGGLVLWPLSFLVENNTCLDSLPVLNDNVQYPKCVCLLDDNHVVFFTNTSCLWLMNIKDRSQKLWFQGNHQDFTCAELRVSKRRNIVAVGSSTGDCMILKYDFNSSQPEVIRRHRWTICDGKILSLIWIEEELITVGPEGKTDLWEIVDAEDGLSARKLCAFLLPPSKQRWLSAAAVHAPRHSPPNLICGSRDGSLHVFHLTKTEHNMQVPPSQSFLRVHGHHGVTCLRCQSRSIFSAGRDGLIRVFRKQNSTFEQMRCIRVAGCPEWIADCRWTPQRQLLVLGFHNDRFVIWDDGLQCVMLDVECGGGHRAWDLLFDERCTKATFVYVKEKRIVVSCTDTCDTKPIEITSGLHSREINAVKHIHTFPDGRVLCATGSEDTTVKIWIFKECQQGHFFEIELFCTLQDHISSVKALNVFADVKCEAVCGRKTLFLFGAGGRALLNCWAVHLPSANSEEEDTECQFLCSHQLHANNLRVKKPWKNPTLSSDPEARYMDMQVWTSSRSPHDLNISIACSDGFVRMFAFCVNSRSIQLLGMFFYKGCCLLRMLRLEVGDCPGVIVTTATDGKMAFWNIDQLGGVCCTTNATGKETSEMKTVYDLKLHQSGIDAVAVKRIRENREEYLIATGGDDGCLVLLQLKVTLKDGELQFSEIWRKHFISAHAAQIEGIDFIDGDRLVSISIDQRLIVWDHDLKPVSCSCTDVSDAQTLITWTNRFGEFYICNAGEGLQIFKIQNKGGLV